MLKRRGGELGPLPLCALPQFGSIPESAKRTADSAKRHRTQREINGTQCKSKQNSLETLARRRSREAAPKLSSSSLSSSMNNAQAFPQRRCTRLPANEKQIQQAASRYTPSQATQTKDVLSVPSLLTRSNTPKAQGLAYLFVFIYHILYFMHM